MSDDRPGSLYEFLEFGDVPERSLVVVNRDGPEPLQRLFEETFSNTPVDVEERDLPGEADDVVLLVEEGEVVASSPLSDLRNTVLLVNVDLYKTGLSGIEKHEAPSVLTALDEMPFTLRGFPHSTKEKLLLVVMARYIERLALEAGAGRLDTGFQRLSRMRDEYGTEAVYDRLEGTDVDVHVYGVPDEKPDTDDVTVHTGTDDVYRHSWFVVFDPPTGAAVDPAAMVAVETEADTWEATWTYDPDRVGRIQRYVVETF
jgi:hypothetical protein